MTLDEMLDGAAAGAAEIAPGWGQGRATYGGLVAGMMVARAETLVGDPARRLRNANVSFIGPVAPGAVALEGSVLRAGSSATQLQVRLVQDGEVRACLLASFGLDRATVLQPAFPGATPRPELAPPETIEPLPHVPKLTPEFFQHVELRFADGAPPFSGASAPDFGGWMRFAKPPTTFGDRELIAVADGWPPAVLPLFNGPVSASSLAWTYEPVAWPAAGESDDPSAHWQYDVRTEAIGAGYANTAARIWDADGRLRALSRQTVAFFG